MEQVSLSSAHRTEDAQPSFRQTWSPSNARALDPNGLPLPKVRRAWERQAQLPCDQDARYRLVWKRYGLRSFSDPDSSAAARVSKPARSERRGTTDSGERAVKRLCLKDEDSAGSAEDEQGVAPRVQYKGTKYERRKSGYTRKIRLPEHDPSANVAANDSIGQEGGCEEQHESQYDSEPPKKSSMSAQQSPTRPRRRKSYGRYSMGAKSTVPQLTSEHFMFKSSEAAQKVFGLNLSPRKNVRFTNTKPSQQDAEAVMKSTEQRDEVESGEDGVALLPVEEEDASEEADETIEDDDTAIDSSGIGLQDAYEPTARLSFSPVRVLVSEHGGQTTPDAVKCEHAPLSNDQAQKEHVEEFMGIVEHAAETQESTAEATGAETASVIPSPSKASSAQVEETTTHLQLDTALLKDFLSRSAAAKASKQTEDDPSLTVARRSSLQNRRESDAVRLALASPRKPLDVKDPNSPLAASSSSTSKVMDLPGVKDLASKLPSGLFAAVDSVDLDSSTGEQRNTAGSGTRRSVRARSRLPAASTGEKGKARSKTIPVKRTADGSDPTAVVLKKTEAQELSTLTRANTRRNKGSALVRVAKLKRLRSEGLAPAWVEGNVKEMAAINASQSNGADESDEDLLAWKVPAQGEKGVRWRPDSELFAYFGYRDSLDSNNTATPGSGTGVGGAEETSCRIPPPSNLTALSASVLQADGRIDSPRKRLGSKAGRMRRLKGLGAANGTPAKGLLASSLLPDDVAEEQEQARAQPQPQPQQEEVQKSRLPTTARKSKIATPSHQLKLAPSGGSAQSLPAGDAAAQGQQTAQESKEKEQRRLATSPKKVSQLSLSGVSLAPSGERPPVAIGKMRKRVALI